MTEYDIKRLAAIYAIQADIDGMKAENEQRRYQGHSMAYNDKDFVTQSETLLQLGTVSDENLHMFIQSIQNPKP